MAHRSLAKEARARYKVSCSDKKENIRV